MLNKEDYYEIQFIINTENVLIGMKNQKGEKENGTNE